MTRRERMLDTAAYELMMDIQSMPYLEGQRFAQGLEDLQLQSMAEGNRDITVRGIKLSAGELANLRMEFREILHDFEDSTVAELDAAEAMEPALDDRPVYDKEIERIQGLLQRDPHNPELLAEQSQWLGVQRNTATLIQDHAVAVADQESRNSDNLIATRIGLGDFDDVA